MGFACLNKLNARLGLKGRSDQYRLLSESEWEYTARAGTTTKYHFGNTMSKSQARFGGGGTAAVGSYPSNAFGLHDMHGNVWEWVQDCWNESYRDAPTDGSAWAKGNCGNRVLRGGSWQTFPSVVRASYRHRKFYGYQHYGNGFRVARTLSQ
jgi:formylglycine-generating enzyme required for sulfatase activity